MCTAVKSLSPHHHSYELTHIIFPSFWHLTYHISYTSDDEPPDTLHYDFSRCDYDALNNTIANINWTNLLANHSTDDSVNHFYATIANIIDVHVPLRRKRRTPNNRQPWRNPGLNHCRNRLRKLVNATLNINLTITNKSSASLNNSIKYNVTHVFANTYTEWNVK